MNRRLEPRPLRPSPRLERSATISPPCGGGTGASRSPTSTGRAGRRSPGRWSRRWPTTSITTTPTRTGPSRPATRPTRSIAEARPGRGRLPQRRARRGRLRQQHDDPDLPPRPGPGPGAGAGRRDRRHRAGPPRQRQPLAGAGPRAGRRRCGPSGCTPRTASSTGTTCDAGQRPDQDPGDRRGVERASGRSTTWPGPPDGPRGRGAGLRRRGPLRPAPAGRRPGDGLRLPRLLGLQVLRPARRASCTAGASCSGRWTCPSSDPRPTPPPSGWRPGRRTTRGSSGPPRRSTSSPRWPRGPTAGAGSRRPSRRSTTGRWAWSPGSGTAWARSTA